MRYTYRGIHHRRLSPDAVGQNLFRALTERDKGIAMLISERNRTVIVDRFKELKSPIVVQFFESSLSCPSCPEVRQLLEELCGLSDLLTLEVVNIFADADKAEAAGIDKAPAIVLTNEAHADFGIRFFGVPGGYEFGTLLEDIIMVSGEDSGLKPATRAKLATLAKSVEIAVFVTPT